MSALPPFKLTCGSLDFSIEAQNLTFSNTDPGGYEIMSFDLQSDRADRINPGDPVTLQDGLGTIWTGRVAEPARTIQHGWHTHRKVGSATTRVSCEGAGAAMKDNLMSMIYVDRNLSSWQSCSVARQINLATSVLVLGDFAVGPDPISGNPSLICQVTGPWASEIVSDVIYDAGINQVGSVWYDVVPNAFVNVADANWTWALFPTPDGITFSLTGSGVLRSAHASGYMTTNLPQRMVMAQFTYNVASTAANTYQVFWRNMTVYGTHGLPGRGPDPVGFYTNDIAGDAARRAIMAGADLRIGQLDSFPNFIVPHYLQALPVPHDTILTDMAKLAPAHYGVWESSSLFGDIPEIVFQAYSNVANVFTTLADCNEADVSERLANLYTSAVITYSDAAGSQFSKTVSLPNSLLNKVGIPRTTTFDLGLSSAQAAAVFGSYVLQILFAQARTAGSIELPKKVRDGNGALIKAYRLKSGIDRIRIADLPTRAGLITTTDTDSFRISRVESNVDTTSGEVKTRVELDAGPNLIETLQARMDIAQQLSGVF